MEEIAKMIIKLSGSYSPSIIFDDWVKILAIMFANNPFIIQDEIWKRREQEYLDVIKKYSKEELEIFMKMYAILIKLFEDEISDYLGEIYMKCEMGNNKIGQFFTPFNLSKLVSEIAYIEPDEKGIYNIYEPTCRRRWNDISLCKNIERKEN